METKIENPKTLFKSEEYPKQQQTPPGVQEKMEVKPDCGETSYRGHGRLRGRKALITGGDSGIGKAVAIAYIREGASVCLNYLPQEQQDVDATLKYLRDECKDCKDVKIETLPGDLKDEQFCTRLVEETRNKLGGLDILVLNAGQQIACKSIMDLSSCQLKETFEVNIFSMFHIIKAALPHLPAGSSIITTSSIEAYNPSSHLTDYSCTKAAIVALTQSLSAQLGEKGIRINTVAPGPIWTVLQSAKGQPVEKLPKFGSSTVFKRAGQPSECAGIYVFLASDEASFCTGDCYPVSGGQHI